MPLSKNSKITIDKISGPIKKSIRNSFSYKGLLKALNSKIITKADIKAGAINEQKNKDLLMDQRAHTVLAEDLEKKRGSVIPNKTGKTSIGTNNKKVNKMVNPPIGPPRRSLGETGETGKVVNKSDGSNVLEKLKKKLGPEFGVGWKGIDADGDLLELVEISSNNWIKFKIDKISGKADIISFPIDKFLKDLDTNTIYGLDQEDAHDLASSNLKKLNNNKRLSLMNKIHSKTMAKLQRIKSKQRNILEQILKRNEDKKIQELLANINNG